MDKPDGNGRGEGRLARETIGNGTGNPAIIAKESLIQKRPPVDLEELLHERDGYGGKWLSQQMQPEYGMLRRSKNRKELCEIWLEDQEIEMELD